MTEDHSYKKSQKILPIREGISINQTIDTMKPFLNSPSTSFKLQKKKVNSCKELYSRKNNSRALVTVTSSFINLLEQTLINQSYAIFLIDKEGYILEFRGDPDTKRIYQNNELNISLSNQTDVSTPFNMSANNAQGPVFVDELEYYTINIDGGWVCCGVPIRDADQKLIGLLEIVVPNDAVPPHILAVLLGICRTVEYEFSKLKKSKNRVFKLKKPESLVLNNMQQAVLALDKDLTIIYINKFGLEMTGLAEEEVLENSLFRIFPFDSAAKSLLVSMLAGEQENIQHKASILLKQEITDVFLQLNQLLNEKGNFIGLVLTISY
jgi:transcriptional regulator of acetoin/glycerol metabolism